MLINPQPKKILVLASNPKGTLNVALETELKRIEDILKRSQYREQFELVSRRLVTPEDLQLALLEEKPQLVHFCGHGEGVAGLIFETEHHQKHLISTEAITHLFSLVAYFVECVLLNACYSEIQAQEISRHINYVIGMRQEILDNVAIDFTVGFYQAIGAGESIESAYQHGCSSIQIQDTSGAMSRKAIPDLTGVPESTQPMNLPHYLIPTLLKKQTLNPITSPFGKPIMTSNTPSPQPAVQKSINISFGNHTKIDGGVVGGNQYNTIYYSGEQEKTVFPKDEVLALLQELKTGCKRSDINENDQDLVVGEIANVIKEVQNLDPKTSRKCIEKIQSHLQETKTILERVRDVEGIAEAIITFDKVVKAIQS